MAPKQSSSRKSAKRVADSAEPEPLRGKRQLNEGLAHLLHLLYNLPLFSDTNLVVEDRIAERESGVVPPMPDPSEEIPIYNDLLAVGFPPVWRSVCPPEFDSLKEDWDAMLLQFAELSTSTAITNLDFRHPALQKIYAMAKARDGKKQKRWEQAIDSTVRKVFAEAHASVLDMWRHPTHIDKTRMPSSSKWNGVINGLLTTIFSTANDVQCTPDAINYWSGWWISKECDRVRAQSKRDIAKLNQAMRKLDGLLGPNWMTGDEGVTEKIAGSQLIGALKSLTSALPGLEWSPLTAADVKKLVEDVPLTRDAMKTHLESLSEVARRHEKISRALGLLCYMAFGGKPVVDDGIPSESAKVEAQLSPEALAGYHRGWACGTEFTAHNQARIEEATQLELEDFMVDFEKFADAYMGHDVEAPAYDPVALLTHPEGDDVGEAFKAEGQDKHLETFTKMETEALHSFLGWPGAHPFSFREHIAGSAADYTATGDVDIPGVTRRFALRQHQAAAIAKMIHAVLNAELSTSRSVTSAHVTPKNWAKAPASVKEQWDRVKGVLLADDVGLGKTFTALGFIATLMDLREWMSSKAPDSANAPGVINFIHGNYVPAPTTDTAETTAPPQAAVQSEGGNDGKGESGPSSGDGNEESAASDTDTFPAKPSALKVGMLDSIPEGAHVIVVPNSLDKQWAEQIRRAFKPGSFFLTTFGKSAREWEKTAENAAKNGPVHRQIYLLTHQTLSRMVQPHLVGGAHPFLRMDNHPFLDRSFLSMTVDEAHDMRVGGKLFLGAEALAQRSFFKTALTATPYMEKPQDVLTQCRLLRAVTQSEYMTLRQTALATTGLKRRLLAKRPVDTQEFSGRTSTLAVHADHDRKALANGMTRLVRRMRKLLGGNFIRRTGLSRDRNDEPISVGLPPLTVVQVAVVVTLAEIKKAEEIEEGEETQGEDRVERARPTSTDFYLKSRQHAAFPPGDGRSPLVTRDNLQDDETMSKLWILGEMVLRILTKGAEHLVPKDFHGTRDRIISAPLLGFSDLSKLAIGERYQPPPPINSPAQAANAPTPTPNGPHEKVIVFTLFQQFQAQIASYLKSFGIKVFVINGEVPAPRRAVVLRECGEYAGNCVLITSNVGSAGLEMVWSRAIILFDVNWSAVLNTQIQGRIHRHGQGRDCYVVQLFNANTRDTYLEMLAINKSEVAEKFMSPAARDKLITHLIDDEASDDGEDEDDDEDDAALLADMKAAVKTARKRLHVEVEAGDTSKGTARKGKDNAKGKAKALPPPSPKATEPSDDSSTRAPSPNEEPPAKKAKGKGKANAPPTPKPVASDVESSANAPSPSEPPPAKKTKGKGKAPAKPRTASKRRNTDGEDLEEPPQKKRKAAKVADLEAGPSEPVAGGSSKPKARRTKRKD